MKIPKKHLSSALLLVLMVVIASPFINPAASQGSEEAVSTQASINPEDLVGRWRQAGNNNNRFEIEYVNGTLTVYTVSLIHRPDIQIYRGEKSRAFYLTLHKDGTLTGPPPSGPFGRVSGKVSADGRQFELEYPSNDSRFPDAHQVYVREQ